MISNEYKWKREFNSDERIREYDTVVNFFSLRRKERFRVLHTLLPPAQDDEYKILDLGSGTGIVTKQLATHYEHAEILAVDGAQKMIDFAKSKKFFRENEDRVKWILADYSSPAWRMDIKDNLNLVVAFDALHHLSHQRKKELYKEIFEILVPGGMLLMSDFMTSYEPFYADPQFCLWIEEIRNVLAQSKRKNVLNLFKDKVFTMIPERLKGYLRPEIRRNFIIHLLKEGDNPMPIMHHVDAMREAGFTNATVEYRYSHFGIISAFKS